MKQSENEPRIVRLAKALAHILEKMPVQIYPDELIVGVASEKPRGAVIYPNHTGQGYSLNLKN